MKRSKLAAAMLCGSLMVTMVPQALMADETELPDDPAAEEAAALLLKRIYQISMPAGEIILPVRLFDEGSTAPPSGRLLSE